MPQRCCVPGCGNSGGHKFPKDPLMHMKWRVAIKREDEKKKLWNPGPHDIVCHWHFQLTDYTDTSGDKGRLKKDAVPSVFPFRENTMVSPRMERMQKRKERVNANDTYQGIQYETTIKETEMDCEIINDDDIKTSDVEIQCELPVQQKYSIENFKHDRKAVNYYTGFSSYEHFMYLFYCLGPAAHDLNYKCATLDPTDQLFLTLMKLRCAKEDLELSLFFKISETTVSKIIVTWINFLFYQLGELDIWSSREVVDNNMPTDFKRKFPSTRVLLDATEFPIQKPSDVNLQSASWSSYKHRNTVKAMIGCTPRGTISYVSDVFAGSASDRQIIEQSTLLSDTSLFKKGDSIMADRGIMVQDLFATRDVKVNTPTMLKGKSQLEPVEIIHDRRVASKRIHIERVIGLSKTFKILKKELPHNKLHLSNRIVKVCFYLSNFKNVIVDKYA